LTALQVIEEQGFGIAHPHSRQFARLAADCSGVAFISGKIDEMECSDACTPILRSAHDPEKSVMDRFVGQFATHPPSVRLIVLQPRKRAKQLPTKLKTNGAGCFKRLILSSVYAVDCNGNVVRYQVAIRN